MAGLEKQRQRYAQAVAEPANGEPTTLVLVTRAQRGSLAEAERTSRELASLGITNQRLIVNGVIPDAGSEDPLAKALITREREAIAHVPRSLVDLPTDHVALQPRNLVGVAALRALLSPTPASDTESSDQMDCHKSHCRHSRG